MALISSRELEVISTDELLQAQAHLWNHMFAFEKSMCLMCSIELNIPDIIHKHGKPMPLSLLAKTLKLDEAKTLCLSRIMRILVHSKFFMKTTMISQENSRTEEEEEYYSITPASCLLLKDKPMTVSALITFIQDPVIMKPWHHISEWLIEENKTNHHLDHSPFKTAHGESFWDLVLYKDMRLKRLFSEGMEGDSSLVSQALINSFGGCFEGIESLVDVGGGTGKIAKAIADAFPSVRCTVFDLPHVVNALESGNRSCNENLRFVGGDMFETIPAADVLLLKWILHDWNDEDCVKILRKCKDALLFNYNKRVGRRLIIIEMILNTYKDGDGVAFEDQLFFDIAMMTYLNGTERTEKQWAKLFSDAGFTDYKVVPGAFGSRSLIEVYP